MDKVRTTAHLIAPHSDLLHTLQNSISAPENDWDDLYMPLINSAADYWQQLENRDGEKLLHAAMNRAMETQSKLSAERPDAASANRQYSCFAAAVLLDIGLPASELAVHVETDSGMIRWNPLINSRIAELGQFYGQSWSAALKSRHHYPIIAYSLLPTRARQRLGSDPRELNLLVCALQGSQDNPIAKYVNPVMRPSDIRNLSPQQKIQPLLKYLQQQLDRRCVNRDESVLFTTEEGLFLQNPNVFQDFDMSCWKESRIALVASGATVPPPQGKLWKLRISKRTGPKIIDGFLIDLKATNLTAPPATGKARTQLG